MTRSKKFINLQNMRSKKNDIFIFLTYNINNFYKYNIYIYI